MPTPSELRSDFNEVIDDAGIPITIRYWPLGSSFYTAADYDEETLNTGSSVVISGGGIMLPLGTQDVRYLEQGKLQADDMALYVAGSLIFNSTARITVGNTGSIYDVIPEYVTRPDVSGTSIYQKVYIRTRPTTT